MSKDLVSEKEDIKFNNIIKQLKIMNFDDVKEEDIKEHNSNWPQTFDHLCRILIIGRSGSGKTSSLFNPISHLPDTDKIHLYPNSPYEAKYQLLINKKYSLKNLNGSKAFIEYLNDKNDIYKNIEEYNPNKKRKILVIFDDMIVDMISNKELNSIGTELFIRGKKLNILLFLLHNLILLHQKNIRLNSTQYFIMKIPNTRELQQIVHQILTLKAL